MKTKTVSEVIQAYIDEVYNKVGGSRKILSDNGIEFKNELFTDVATQLGVEHKVHSLLIIPNPMKELRDFIISSKHACLNMYPSLLSGTK